MYLHIGNNEIIKEEDILGIFDLDTVTVTKASRDFLNKKERQHRIKYITDELPKSFIYTASKDKKHIMLYFSQLAPTTLIKRLDKNDYQF